MCGLSEETRRLGKKLSLEQHISDLSEVSRRVEGTGTLDYPAFDDGQ